jgi:hypothetical protein
VHENFLFFPICSDRFEVYPTSWVAGDLRRVRRLKREANHSVIYCEIRILGAVPSFPCVPPSRCATEQLSVRSLQRTVAVFIAGCQQQPSAAMCCMYVYQCRGAVRRAVVLGGLHRQWGKLKMFGNVQAKVQLPLCTPGWEGRMGEYAYISTYF